MARPTPALNWPEQLFLACFGNCRTEIILNILLANYDKINIKIR
jgi:hypothetical protein